MESVEKVEINVIDYLTDLFNRDVITKELYSNSKYTEEVCEKCHGTGIGIDTQRFGVAELDGVSLFPHINESIWTCRECYFGKVQRCNFCGKLIPRGRVTCDCESANAIKVSEKKQKEIDEFDKAELADAEAFEMFYSDNYPYNNGYFTEMEELFDIYRDLGFSSADDIPDRPEFVWGTDKEFVTLNISDVLDNACEEAYEDARSDIDREAECELQKYIDKWMEKHGPGATYYASNKFKVRIPWENYND